MMPSGDGLGFFYSCSARDETVQHSFWSSNVRILDNAERYLHTNYVGADLFVILEFFKLLSKTEQDKADFRLAYLHTYRTTNANL